MKTKAATELLAKLDVDLKKYRDYASNSANAYASSDNKEHQVDFQKFNTCAGLLNDLIREVTIALHRVEAESSIPLDKIVLPREMDEDLWYIVGGAVGAESPEQCSRAAPLWNKLVARSDRDAKKNL